MPEQSYPLSPARARDIWLRAQRLHVAAPFGEGPAAVRMAAEHLGYIQIDTINVIERAHHHILYSRIPAYTPRRPGAGSVGGKNRFSNTGPMPWPMYRPALTACMYRPWIGFRARPSPSFAGLDQDDYAALLQRIRAEGPLSIRDIDEALVGKKPIPGAAASRQDARCAMAFLPAT